MTTESTPRVYVGTYAKYNAGSIKGAWLNLEDYGDKESFLAACAELHADESDPEFMFQDYEGFPSCHYSESSVSEKLWDWLELDADDRELLDVYLDNVSSNSNDGIDDAREAFMGKHDNESDWAASWHDLLNIRLALPQARHRCRSKPVPRNLFLVR